jgi:predicted nucleic acid-binding protein
MPVLDASVVVDCISPDVPLSSSALRTLARLTSQGAELIGPRLVLAECASALLMGIRKGRWTGAAADRAFGFLLTLPIKLADEALHMDRAWDLSRRYDNHPIYDMVYVAVAEAARTDLITADETLRTRLQHMAWIKAPDQ